MTAYLITNLVLYILGACLYLGGLALRKNGEPSVDAAVGCAVTAIGIFFTGGMAAWSVYLIVGAMK